MEVIEIDKYLNPTKLSHANKEDITSIQFPVNLSLLYFNSRKDISDLNFSIFDYYMYLVSLSFIREKRKKISKIEKTIKELKNESKTEKALSLEKKLKKIKKYTLRKVVNAKSTWGYINAYDLYKYMGKYFTTKESTKKYIIKFLKNNDKIFIKSTNGYFKSLNKKSIEIEDLKHIYFTIPSEKVFYQDNSLTIITQFPIFKNKKLNFKKFRMMCARALAQLPLKHDRKIDTYYLSSLSQKRIADILQVSEQTVNNYLNDIPRYYNFIEITEDEKNRLKEIKEDKRPVTDVYYADFDYKKTGDMTPYKKHYTFVGVAYINTDLFNYIAVYKNVNKKWQRNVYSREYQEKHYNEKDKNRIKTEIKMIHHFDLSIKYLKKYRTLMTYNDFINMRTNRKTEIIYENEKEIEERNILVTQEYLDEDVKEEYMKAFQEDSTESRNNGSVSSSLDGSENKEGNDKAEGVANCITANPSSLAGRRTSLKEVATTQSTLGIKANSLVEAFLVLNAHFYLYHIENILNVNLSYILKNSHKGGGKLSINDLRKMIWIDVKRTRTQKNAKLDSITQMFYEKGMYAMTKRLEILKKMGYEYIPYDPAFINGFFLGDNDLSIEDTLKIANRNKGLMKSNGMMKRKKARSIRQKHNDFTKNFVKTFDYVLRDFDTLLSNMKSLNEKDLFTKKLNLPLKREHYVNIVLSHLDIPEPLKEILIERSGIEPMGVRGLVEIKKSDINLLDISVSIPYLMSLKSLLKNMFPDKLLYDLISLFVHLNGYKNKTLKNSFETSINSHIALGFTDFTLHERVFNMKSFHKSIDEFFYSYASKNIRKFLLNFKRYIHPYYVEKLNHVGFIIMFENYLKSDKDYSNDLKQFNNKITNEMVLNYSKYKPSYESVIDNQIAFFFELGRIGFRYDSSKIIKLALTEMKNKIHNPDELLIYISMDLKNSFILKNNKIDRKKSFSLINQKFLDFIYTLNRYAQESIDIYKKENKKNTNKKINKKIDNEKIKLEMKLEKRKNKDFNEMKWKKYFDFSNNGNTGMENKNRSDMESNFEKNNKDDEILWQFYSR